MTSHGVVVDPPRTGGVLTSLVESGAVSAADAATLYQGLVKDTLRNVETSGGELTVFVPPPDTASTGDGETTEPAAELRALGVESLDDPDAVTIVEQTGGSKLARTADAIEWLTANTEEATVAVLDVRAPLLFRSVLDQAAMQLRRHDVVIAPSPHGRAAYLGLAESLDASDTEPALGIEALVAQATRANLSVGFLPVQPFLESTRDLAGLRSLLRARATADHVVPVHTFNALQELSVFDAESPQVD